jgi:meso-butanediol dehydrogenase/(S,S)-butanediol dehydrogenase/diacetyl reductase
MTMAGRLSGKVALISGTGGGIGRAASLLFAAEGARVVGTDVDAEAAARTQELVRDSGYAMLSIAPLDVSTPEGAHAWVDDAVKACGGFDILYNNAGDTRFAPFADMSVADYEHTIRNELGVTWHCTQAAWPHLIARGGGVVLNCGSIAGINGSRDLPQSAHVAAKGAIMALTRQLAAEGAAVGIRVNTICPGLIESPAVIAILADAPQLVMSMVERTCERRPGLPNEVAQAALFLVSEEASYVSGSALVVDGGTTSLI